MKQMKVGNSELVGSQLILGCMRMSALSTEEASKVIQTVNDAGVNFYDHADIYGAGQSEVTFAKALKQTSIARDQIILQSKTGIRKGFFDFSKEHILDSVDGILSRLDTDYLDILLLHRPDTLMEPEEVAEAFTQLHKAGKVRYFGVSNQNQNQIELLQHYIEQSLIANQLQFGPAHTPLIDEGINVNMQNARAINRTGGLLEYCRLKNITIQPWSPFQVDLEQGLFIHHINYKQLTATLMLMANQKGVSLEALVIAWILRHPANMQPIVGSMDTYRLSEIAKGTHVQLSREEWYEIYRSAGNLLP